MNIKIEFEEVDGCWIAEAPEFPGVSACGATQRQAAAKAKTLILHMANTLLAA